MRRRSDGIFIGAATLFFTYVGFDAISNTAEEVGSLSQTAGWSPRPLGA